MSHNQTNLTSAANNPQPPPAPPLEDVEQGHQEQEQDHNPQQPLHVDNAPAVPAPGPEVNEGRGIHWEWQAVVKAVGCIVVVLIYLGFFFVALISISIGIAALCSVIWELLSQSPLSPTIQSLVTLISLTVLAEVDTIQPPSQWRRRIGAWLLRNMIPRPIILLLPVIVIALYLAALSQLYSQYLVVHPANNQIMTNSAGVVSQIASNSTSSFNDSSVREKMNRATFLFMLSISYMIYVTAKSSDWTSYRHFHYNFDPTVFSDSCCCAYFKHLGIQLWLLFMYSLLLGLMCVVSHVILYLPLGITYTIIILASVMLGINAVYLETRKPFPVVPQKAPYFEFEMHLMAKSHVTVYVLHPTILWLFYFSNHEPLSNHQLQDPDKPMLVHCRSKFNDETFLMYMTLIGLIVIGSLKIILNSCYSNKLIRRPRQPQPPPVPPPVIPEVAELELNLEEPITSQHDSHDSISILVEEKDLEDLVSTSDGLNSNNHGSKVETTEQKPSPTTATTAASDLKEEPKLV